MDTRQLVAKIHERAAHLKACLKGDAHAWQPLSDKDLARMEGEADGLLWVLDQLGIGQVCPKCGGNGLYPSCSKCDRSDMMA